MCNKEHLVGYLYGELSAADGSAFEAHIAECPDCRVETEALRRTRQYLATWAPPEPELNFTVLQSTRAAATAPARWLALVPQWGLAAAAALLLIAGAAAIANVEVRYGQDGSLVVRTGWSAPPADIDPTRSAGATSPAALGQAGAAAPASEELKTELIALQRRLRQVEESLAQSQDAERTRAAGSVRPGISAPELRKILAESEARHRTELAVRIAQVWNDFNAARASDLVRVQQTLEQKQGMTNLQLRQQRETLDSLRYLQTVFHPK